MDLNKNHLKYENTLGVKQYFVIYLVTIEKLFNLVSGSIFAAHKLKL